MSAVFLSLLLSLVSAPADPSDLVSGYRSRTGAWGTVLYREAGGEDEALASSLEASLRRVEGRLGRARGRPFTAILASEPEFQRVFRELAGRRPDDWILGAAFPGRDLLLVRGRTFGFLAPPSDRPARVLDHEIAHLVLHRRPGVDIPPWFDEGAAMWAAGQVLDPQDEAFLSGLARLKSLYSLQALERELPQSHELASLAYQESLLFVEWLRWRFGPDTLASLLDRFEEGKPPAAALEECTGLDVQKIEEEFRLHLAGRRSLWEVLVSSVNFWTLTSLLALVAIVRGAVSRRRKLREMEEAEKAEGLPDPESAPEDSVVEEP